MRRCELPLTVLLLLLTAPLAGAAAPVDGGKPPVETSHPGPSASLPPPPKEIEARRVWLRTRLDETLASQVLGHAKISAIVMDGESGAILYARNEKAGLNAASNVKIVTEAAALSLLGPEYRWKTTVLAPPPAEGGKSMVAGELHGDLYLRTSGDPTLTTQDLGEVAASLAATGLRKVRGGLILDASAFDAAIVGPAYDQKNESAAFRAPSSAASLNSNTVTVTIVPGPAAGSPARVFLDPASNALVLHGAVTTAAKGPASIDVETSDAGNGQTRVTVAGRILLGSDPRVLQRRVALPETYLAETFRQVLNKRGISLDKPTRVDHAPKEGLRVLVVHDSPPLGVVVHELGKHSSNFAAEQIVRTIGAEIVGRPGTWQKGLDAIARYLEGVGIARNSYGMKNGSGLYESSRFSAEQIATVLRAATRDFRIASEFLASLAVGGADGTLAHRMTGSAAERFVRAKTGTLANVSCLSGLVGAPGSKPIIFSILMNDVPSPVAARGIQDRAIAALALYLDPSLAK